MVQLTLPKGSRPQPGKHWPAPPAPWLPKDVHGQPMVAIFV